MKFRPPAWYSRLGLACGVVLVSLIAVPGSASAHAHKRACRHAHHHHHHTTCAGHHRARVSAGSRRRSAPNKAALVQLPTASASPFFSPQSIWNAPLASTAPLDPNSTAIVGNLLQQEATEARGVNTASYGTPIYTVPAGQPTVHVTLDQGPAQAAMQQAFNAVPIPADAQPAPGTDGYLVVYQPSTDTMWEFWKLSMQATGWHARWGGKMDQVSTNPGYYRNVVDSAGNVLERPWWGAPASSFPRVAGTMTIAELEAGQINHALSLAIHNTCAGEWAAPAQRTDGNISGDPTCIPEGAHFRLDPNLDLASLNLPHFVLMLAQAAQKYGIIVNDRTAGIGFQGEDPAQFKALYGYNPYMGPQNQPGTPGALFDEWPSQFMQQFPWSHLQLLSMGTLQTTYDMTTIVVP